MAGNLGRQVVRPSRRPPCPEEPPQAASRRGGLLRGERLMPHTNVPHPEERPGGVRLEGRTATVQPSESLAAGGAAAYWRQTLWAMVGIQFVMTAAFSMLTPILPLFLPVLGVGSEAGIDIW